MVDNCNRIILRDILSKQSVRQSLLKEYLAQNDQINIFIQLVQN